MTGGTREGDGKDVQRLFCLSGGGFPGFDLYAGMWMALAERGIVPTEIHGTSAGAGFGALIAAGRNSAIDLVNLVMCFDDRTMRDERLFWQPRAMWVDWFLGQRGIEKALADNLPEEFYDLKIPLHVYAVNDCIGEWFAFHRGPLRKAVMASMAIPGVFAPVNIGGMNWVDGGLRKNLPLPGNWRDFDEVWLLIASRPVNYKRVRNGILSNLLHAVDVMAEDQIDDVIDEVEPELRKKVRIIRPPHGRTRGALRFAPDLINEAYAYTRDALEFNMTTGGTRA